MNNEKRQILFKNTDISVSLELKWSTILAKFVEIGQRTRIGQIQPKLDRNYEEFALYFKGNPLFWRLADDVNWV